MSDRHPDTDEILLFETSDEHVAESLEQGEIIRTLFSSLRRLARLRGWNRVLIGADNYFAWSREQPGVRVSPDVYLLDDPPERLPEMWRTWLPGNPPPRWALGIVSEDWRKDYEQAPAKYSELGCRELVVFDPDAASGETRIRQRVALTVFRRTRDGSLAKAYEGAGPAFSNELSIWLIATREGYSPRLRLSEDEAGTRIVLTGEEAELAERAAREAERAARLAAEKARDELEHRIRELEKRSRG